MIVEGDRPGPSRLAGRGLALAIAAYAGLYLLPLGQRPLQTPDELRYAEIAREMSASGDWVVPHLNGLRYLEKPPLGYWLMAGSAICLGKGSFAARLPSALATGLTALLIGVLLRRGGQAGNTPLLASVLFLTGAEVYALGTAAILDPLLSAGITGSLLCGYVAWQTDRPRQRSALLLGAGALAGLAFLAKGLLALALPVVVFGPFLAWQGETRGLLRRSWIPSLAFLAVALPWSLSIHAQAPDFWGYFVTVQHLERFASARADHPQPFWFLAPYLVAGMLPWTLLAPAAFTGLRRLHGHPLLRFAVCGMLGPLLLLSSSRGKLGTYVLPCLPFVAVLLALGLGQRDSGSDVHRTPARTAAAACLGLVVFLGIDAAFAPAGLVRQHAADLRLGAIALAAGGAAALFLQAARAPLATGLGWFAAAAGCLLLAVPWSIRGGSGRFAPADFVAAARGRIPPDAWLVADTACLYALGFVLGRADVYLVRPGELRYALAREPGAKRLWGETGLLDRLADARRDHDVALCVAARRFDRLRASLPAPSSLQTSRQLTLAVFPHPPLPKPRGPHSAGSIACKTGARGPPLRVEDGGTAAHRRLPRGGRRPPGRRLRCLAAQLELGHPHARAAGRERDPERIRRGESAPHGRQIGWRESARHGDVDGVADGRPRARRHRLAGRARRSAGANLARSGRRDRGRPSRAGGGGRRAHARPGTP